MSYVALVTVVTYPMVFLHVAFEACTAVLASKHGQPVPPSTPRSSSADRMRTVSTLRVSFFVMQAARAAGMPRATDGIVGDTASGGALTDGRHRHFTALSEERIHFATRRRIEHRLVPVP